MPFNGSGTFTLVSGNPVVTGSTISSTWANNSFTDFATGFTTCLTKDGQTTPTANLPMGNFKHTGAGSASASGQYLVYGQNSAVLGSLNCTGTQTMTGAVANIAAEVDVASATATDIGGAASNSIRITGTTQIDGFGTTYTGPRFLRFAGILQLTNSSSLVLPGGANITTAAGDTCIALPLPSSAGWYVSTYTKASGAPVIVGIDNSINDFRLTLSTGVPVTTTDVAAATTVYCCPYKGNRIALYDGSGWNVRTSAEFSLALGTLTSGLPYDVFCYDNAGVPTLEFLAWTNTTTRATALAYQDGILSKTGALTRRYLGTFYTISTTQTADSKTVGRFLYNYYNRVLRNTQGTFASDRSTTGTSYGELNAEIQNKFILGVSEDAVTGDVAGTASNSAAANQYTATALAFDSTSTAEAGFETTFGNSGGTANVKMPCGISGSKIGLAVGYHYATLLGKVDGGTGTWNSATSATSAKVYLSLGIMG